MNIEVHLYKDSNCDLCKLMQKELTDNPPSADVTIFHVKHDYNKHIVEKLEITRFPCTIIVDSDNNTEIERYIGFIDSKTINNKIKEHEKRVSL